MNVIKLLTSFRGRISRQQYWLGKGLIVFGYIVAANVMESIVTPSLMGAPMLGESFSKVVAERWQAGQIAGASPIPRTIIVIVLAVCLVLSLAVDVKRSHDRNKSGWYVLIGLIPVVGWAWLLIELGFLRGTPGPNRFEPEDVRPAPTAPVPPAQMAARQSFGRR